MGIVPAGTLSVPASLGSSDFSFQDWWGRQTARGGKVT